MPTDLEYTLTHCMKDDMLVFMADHPECVGEALELAVSDKQPFAWRAAWLLTSVLEKNDPRLKKHVKRLVKAITGKEDGHQRELVKILLLADLPDNEEGRLFDVCVTLWETVNKQPSVRYTAFRFISQVAKKYPDLLNEVEVLLRDEYLESLSPGVRRGVRKMMADLR